MKNNILRAAIPVTWIIAFQVALSVTLSGTCRAEPILQLYAEGATYNPDTQSWEKEYQPGENIRLWAIGWVSSKTIKSVPKLIEGVKLSIAYESQPTAPVFTLVASTTGDYEGFYDPSKPGVYVGGVLYDAYLKQGHVTDGSAPLFGDGVPIPAHGIFGKGTDWTEFLLGDFSLMDSPMADFTTGSWSGPIPPPGTKLGQINVYEISVSNLLSGSLHFDLYDHFLGSNGIQYKFAPFSHDADITTVPEPGTMILLGSGLVGLAGWGRKKFRK
jgi:hypothetical protein